MRKKVPLTKKKVVTKKRDKLSLHPMTFDEALANLLTVKPEKRKEPKKRRKT